MVLDAVSNFVRGSTDAAVGTSDTTVSVADASIFPDPATDGEFNVVIWDVNNFPRPDQDGDVEILRVTARDTDANELTVTRGQEMTSAAAHPEGSAIHLSPTAKMFSDIESTFGDFWDAGTQELTADVNNTNTTTTALEADKATTANGYELRRGIEPRFVFDDERVNIDISLSDLNIPSRGTAKDVVVIECNLRHDRGDQADPNIKATINNDTSTAYSQINRDATALNQSDDNTEWELVEESSNGGTYGEWKVSSPRNRARIFGNGSSGFNWPSAVLVDGKYNESDDVDSIQIFQEDGELASGWVQVSVEVRT